MAGNSTESGRSVTSKITSILLTFTEGSEHSLTEIARLAGLPISTAHRLTSELASWRLLERTEDGHYRAGLPLRMIGTVDACPPEHRRAGSVCAGRFRCRHKCRARLGVLRDLEVAYIQKQPDGQPSTSFSRLHAARTRHRPGPGAAGIRTPPHRRDDNPARTSALPRTRSPHRTASQCARGHPADPGRRHPLELEAGMCGVAMPVFGPGSEVAAAFELAVRDLGTDLKPVIGPLSIAARSLSRELGGAARDERFLKHIGRAVAAVNG